MDLSEIEARVGAATVGPWFDIQRDPNYTNIESGAEPYVSQPALVAIVGHKPEDAVFIAHARTDVPALLKRVKQLEAVIVDAVEADTWGIKYGDTDRQRLENIVARLTASGLL